MKKLENYTEIHSLIRKQKDNFPADYYSLDIVDKDDNIILRDKNKFASGPAAQGYFESHYLKKHNVAKTPKIKIESVYVEAKTGDCPDTSWLGKYTIKASDWAIDRKRNDFCIKLEQRERIIEILQERLKLFFDENNEYGNLAYQKRIENRITKIEQSFPHESHIDRNSYEYFLPCNHVPHNPKNWDHVQGKERAAVIKEHGSVKMADMAYAMQDYNRMEALNNGQWYYIGIIAKAKILIPLKGNPGSSQYQAISSGGLWGIESDSGEDCLQETAREQLQDLAGQLEALGIGKRAIQYAIKQWDGEIIYQ
jgi:hypothetical protein